MRPVTVAAVAFEAEFAEPARNSARMAKLAATAAVEGGAGWVCFPEVALQGYHADIALMRSMAETVEGPHLVRCVASDSLQFGAEHLLENFDTSGPGVWRLVEIFEKI
eukprot:SAG31_NODE_2517_length_5576_cov_3.265839_2_plen_108_part_00